jgi:hypothetical protein
MIIHPYVIKKVSSEPPVEGDYKVRFIDYDGKVIKEQKVASGQSATPPTPSHKFLTLDYWQGSYENVTEDTDVYAIYKTTNGSTYLFVDVTVASGKDVSVYINKATADITTIYLKNSADEVIDTKTVSGTGNKTATLTASNYGKHYVEICSDGGSYTLGGGSTTAVIGGSTSAQREMLYRCFVGIASIGSYAFHNCSSLASITIPEGVTSISNRAFYNCYALASITIPEGVTSISDSAFSYCSSLASITIPEGVTSIGSGAFSYCFSLASITIPEGVTRIGNSAFQACYSLASITIPEGVTSIGDNAFRDCRSLPSITISSDVTSIGDRAFYNCYSLTSITIPSSVTSIGDNAFYNCYSCKEYIFTRLTRPTLGTNAFTNITSANRIFVPDESLDDYKNATNWVSWANYIYPISAREN